MATVSTSTTTALWSVRQRLRALSSTSPDANSGNGAAPSVAAQRYAARGALPSTHATLSSSRATKDRGASSQSPTAARAARDPDRPRRVRRVSTVFAGTPGRAEADVDVVRDELRV